MKLLRRLLSGITALALVSGTGLITAAAKGDPYTYTVRIYAGQQGSIEGREVMEYTDLPYGARINFSNGMVSLKDDTKYYVKGIRESGKDNKTAERTGRSMASFTVTGDQDYVVAYAMLGDAVAYTVNYTDTDGNELAPSETYYGNVGDKPVIAYLYIEGYQPRTYNLTKTLSANAAENVFTFQYSVGTGVAAGEDVTPLPGVAIVPGGAGEQNAGGEVPPPEELIDIDDNEVPLANANNGGGQGLMDDFLASDGYLFWRHIPVWTKITAAAVLAGTIWAVLWLWLFRRKEKEREVTLDSFGRSLRP